MLLVVEYHGGQNAQRKPPSIVRRSRRLPRVLDEDVGRQRAPLGQRALADLGVVAEQAHGRRSRPRARCPPARLSRNSNRPFWLLVPPGMAATLIWSKSSSPEYSTTTPALNVVASLDQRGRVRAGMDRTARERRVRTAVDLVEARDRDRRELVLDLLAREDVRIVDVGAAPLVQAGLGEDVDEDFVERIRIAHLVQQVVAQRGGPAGDLRGVGPAPSRCARTGTCRGTRRRPSSRTPSSDT